MKNGQVEPLTSYVLALPVAVGSREPAGLWARSEWRKGRTQTPDSRLSRPLGVLPPRTVSPGFCFVDTGEKYLECLPFCIVTTLLLHPSVDNQELTLIHGKIVKTLLSHYDAV